MEKIPKLILTSIIFIPVCILLTFLYGGYWMLIPVGLLLITVFLLVREIVKIWLIFKGQVK